MLVNRSDVKYVTREVFLLAATCCPIAWSKCVFPNPTPAVNKKRIIRASRRSRHSHRRRMRVVYCSRRRQGNSQMCSRGLKTISLGGAPFRSRRFRSNPRLGLGIRHLDSRPRRTRGIHAKLHFQALSAGLRQQHIVNQPQVIVLKPNFAKIIGHFQCDHVDFQGGGFYRQEPQIKDIWCSTSCAEVAVLRAPDFFSGGLHFAQMANVAILNIIHQRPMGPFAAVFLQGKLPVRQGTKAAASIPVLNLLGRNETRCFASCFNGVV